MSRTLSAWCAKLGLLATLALVPAALQAQTGTVTGRIVDTGGQPLADVQVSLDGTTLGGLTQANGRYVLLNVPAGVYTLSAQRIGYATRRRDNVVVAAGEQVTIDLELSVMALSLQEIVVTGVVDPVEGIKLPFTVGRIGPENLEVPTAGNTSAIASLQGKVAGVSIMSGSGQPGDGVDVLLRTPTTIQGSQTPMFVVDGVVLGGVGGTTVDLQSLDIESVEVIKGAAAASLYGSRAANGVISIRTKRGSHLEQGQTRITVRSEFGQNDLPNRVQTASAHPYLQREDGAWIDGEGNVVDRANRVVASDNFLDNEYQTPLFDNLGTFYNPGGYISNTVSLAQNTASTNFFLSATQQDTEGALTNNQGFQQTSFRLNVDHRMFDQLQASASIFHSVGKQDELSGSPFRPILSFEPDVNLGLRGEDGEFLQQPDPTVTTENPIWRQASRDNENDRNRILASTDVRWSPLNWLRLSGSFSYDRAQREDQVYVPRGTSLSLTDPTNVSNGQLEYQNFDTETLNGSLDAQLLHSFEGLTARATFRGLFERERSRFNEADGRDLIVVGVPDLDAAAERFISSSFSEIRANGYLADLALDFQDRYIGSVLVRRDGSSLFGEDARWNTYWRGAASWLVARESWWPFDNIGEFKLRYAYGTAGNRPNFNYQYETWTVNGSTGAVSKATLGNRNLRPEYTIEQDFGVDAIIADRFQVRLSYIKNRTEDQIIQLPLPAVTGYSSQWTNTGVQEGTTWEAELEAFLMNRPNMSWSATLVADRSRSEIVEWNRSCFFSTLRNICGGAGLGEMWGESFITSLDQLPEEFQDRRGEFQVNDDGYVVWVGEGNTYQDGVSKNLWGTSSDEVTWGGSAARWGMPLIELDENGGNKLQQIGRSEPDVSLGLLNRFRWGGISVYSHIWGQFGGKIYNNTRQRLYQDQRHADLDQRGKDEGLKKTLDYYQALYNANVNTSHFVEDGTFIKLRELAVTYTLSPERVQSLGLGRLGASQVSFGLIGRNLFTWTDYTGFDPEVGTVLQRDDSFDYPNLRTITGQFSITF